MTKSVDKEGFHNTFEVVEAPVVHGIGLDRMNHTLTLVTKILVQGKVVEDGVYYQRAQILPEKKCAVINLHTQIFEHHAQTV